MGKSKLEETMLYVIAASPIISCLKLTLKVPNSPPPYKSKLVNPFPLGSYLVPFYTRMKNHSK